MEGEEQGRSAGASQGSMAKQQACARARGFLQRARDARRAPVPGEVGGCVAETSSSPSCDTPSQASSLPPCAFAASERSSSQSSRRSVRLRPARPAAAGEEGSSREEAVQSISGNRICSMDSFVTVILPCIRCPSCLTVGVLVARAQDEISLGVAGIVELHCLKCRRGTLSWDQSKGARRLMSTSGKPQPGPTTRDLNIRAVIGSMQVGLGQGQLEKLFGILDLPSLTRTPSNTAILGTSGKPWKIHWMKPGKAMNSAEGYGEAIGSLSRKCVMTAHRSKVGPLANHRGSSGSMEPLMGAEIVTKLNTEENGVYVGCLCMDLDAKTPKAVAAAVKDTAYAPPKREHDPNHYVKAIRKRFIDVKKKNKFPNVFPPATQKKLGDEVALAVHQHRGSNGSKEKLRGAILNVVDHAFNNHLRCREFFACPCAPDAHGVIKRTISSYKNGEWLDLAGADGRGRIGGATDLTSTGQVSPLLLQAKGRWASDIGQIYSRMTRRAQLAASELMYAAKGRDLEELLPDFVQAA
ncbi:hypothetical protein AB1Y20_003409 [Prymnesium parvum]|uniref:Mutator-like transposase domain-containing protein n=1 Tax=Prymnesium parvum TaxID=97485 RepID=A0AB34JBI2_PRYPA